MKRRILLLLAVVCVLALFAGVLCACDNTDTPNTPNTPNKPIVGGNDGNNSGGNNNGNNSQNPNDTEQPKELKVYCEVVNYMLDRVEAEMQFSEQNGTKVYTFSYSPELGDRFSFYDSNGATYDNYYGKFDGVAKFFGEHVFTLKITGDSAIIYVDEPEFSVQFEVYNSTSGSVGHEMQSSEQNGVKEYTITRTLSVGDRVYFHSNDGATYSSYNGDFDGVIKIAGEYVFTLKLTGNSGTIFVNAPQPPTPQPPTPQPPVPKDTKVTVHYTNSERWSNVYAYVWNYKTGTPKTSWPGTGLTANGTSGYGETQYAVEVDYAQYDRIIFNNGAGEQTKDLVVGAATSGYYGKDGVFTMNTENYGKVQYFTLKDTKNLQYIANNSKKVSVYTPAGYTASKKYGVLYMFDSQNLYVAANGAEPSSDSYGSWAVDVAVTSLVKNGNDGIIIVAIDNSDRNRDSELTMSQSFGTITNLADNNNAFYNGKLDELGNFIKETLMPFVQSRFSVDTRRESTGIAGSSSGGLAAYYLGLRDNDLYGYVGAFSPANGLFTTESWTRFYAGKNFSAGRPKIYAYCGTGDGGLEDMLLPATKEISKLKSYGFAAESITENYVTGGTHSENYWRIAFADFLSKMFG